MTGFEYALQGSRAWHSAGSKHGSRWPHNHNRACRIFLTCENATRSKRRETTYFRRLNHASHEIRPAEVGLRRVLSVSVRLDPGVYSADESAIRCVSARGSVQLAERLYRMSIRARHSSLRDRQVSPGLCRESREKSPCRCTIDDSDLRTKLMNCR